MTYRFARTATALCAGAIALLTMIAPAWADTSIAAAGSTALLPLAKAGAQLYSQTHPDINISVTGGGSGVGLAQVAGSAVDIGNSDVLAPSSSGLMDHKVAVVGFAMIANPAITVRSLTQKQIADIFSGHIKNWSQVGGPHLDIVIVNRPGSSGTRKVFNHIIMANKPIADTGLTVDASGTVVSTVNATPGSISYVALSALRNAHLRVIAINHVAPSTATITTGRYPFWSYEHMYTKGKAPQAVADFIAYITGNSILLTKLGYVPVRAMHTSSSDR